jgi:hypothetical protein
VQTDWGKGRPTKKDRRDLQKARGRPNDTLE